MTHPRDDRDVETTERLLAGDPVVDAAVPAELVALVAALRAAGREVPPTPSTELARVLREGRSPDVVPFARRRAARPMTRRVVVAAALGTKIALVGAAAAAALTGVATLEPVPDVIRDPARDLVDGVVDVLPWVPDPPAEPAPAGVPTPAGVPGTPGEGRGPADDQGPATPEEPGRQDEAPGRPASPPGEAGRDDDGDGAPGRSEDAPGAPGSTPQSPDDGRGRPATPGERAPQAPADPPAGRPGDKDAGPGGSSTGAMGDADPTGRTSAAADPYPEARVER